MICKQNIQKGFASELTRTRNTLNNPSTPEADIGAKPENIFDLNTYNKRKYFCAEFYL